MSKPAAELLRFAVDQLPYAAWHYLLLPLWLAASGIGIATLALFAIGSPAPLSADTFRALDGMAGIAAALGLVALQTGVGCRILSILRWDRLLSHGVERALFGWMIGFVSSSGAAMLAAGANALNPISIGIGLLGLAIIGAPTIMITLRWAFDSQRTTWRALDAQALTALAVAFGASALALIWLWPLLTQTLLPNSDWDSALYHLPLATRYLNGELWNSDPVFSAYSFPGAVSLMYSLFLSLGLESAIIPFNFVAVLMTGVASVSLAGRVGGRRVALWTGAIFCTTHIFWQLGVDPRIDIFLCLLVLLAIYAFSLWMLSEHRHELLYLVALALSGALGCKYSALLYAGGIGGAALLGLIWQSRGWTARTRARRIATLAALFVLPHGAWYGANLVIHGDPVFALMRGDYAVGPDGEARYLTEALEQKLSEVPADPLVRPIYEKMNSIRNQTAEASLFDLRDVLLRPTRYSPKPNHFASPFLLGFLLLPVVLAWEGRRSRRESDADPAPGGGPPLRHRLFWIYSIWGIAFYCLVATQIPVLRYQLPVFPLLALGAAIVVSRLGTPWQAALALLALAIVVSNGVAERHKLDRLNADAYLSGEKTRLEWLSQVGYNGEPSMPRVIDFVNASIASGSMKAEDRILMLGEGKGQLLECLYLPDSSWSFQRWLGELLNADFDHAELHRRLRAQGVTHILYNRGYYDWVLTNTGTERERLALGVSHLRRFFREYGTEIYDTRKMRLLRL